MLFNRLRIYTVHLKPGESTASIEQLRFVSEGFNFYAFIFTIFWALYNRMWRLAGLLLMLNLVVFLSTMQLELLDQQITSSILQFGLQLWTGFSANDFMRAHLKRQGFITYALVSGENEIRAEQRFFDNNHQHLTS